VDPADGLMALRRRFPPCRPRLEVGLQVRPVRLLGDPLPPHGRIRTLTVVGACQGRPGDHMGPCGAPSCGGALRSLPSLHKSRCQGSPWRSRGQGALLQGTSPWAACARAGPAATPFPDVSAPMPPSAALPPAATAPAPLAGGRPRCGRLCWASRADAPCACPRVGRRRRVTGSPQHRQVARRGAGLPGYGAVLCMRAIVAHPAGYASLLAPLTPRTLGPSRNPARSASGKTRGGGAATPWPTRSQAYASHIPALASAPGLLPARAGTPLAGPASHLRDDTQRFMKASHPPMPCDPQGLVALYFLYA
jgi:hypothetical protein